MNSRHVFRNDSPLFYFVATALVFSSLSTTLCVGQISSPPVVAKLDASVETRSSSQNNRQPGLRRSEVSQSIQKSLKYIDERGKWWMQKKDCMSCHRVSFTVWSQIEAFQAGIIKDRTSIDQLVDWCMDDLFEPIGEKNRKFPKEKNIDRNLSGAAQILFATSNWKLSVDQMKRADTMIEHLRRGQQKNGKWTPAGQLPFQKRELVETSHVFTMWNALSLSRLADQARFAKSNLNAMIDPALEFSQKYSDGKSTEWHALKLAVARKLKLKKQQHDLLAMLARHQHDDGGWGWMIADGMSDALATGQVVFLLLETGTAPESELIQRALKYLVNSQTEHGSWTVNGTKKKAKDKPQETSNYWGTTWACIALSRSLVQEQHSSR